MKATAISIRSESIIKASAFAFCAGLTAESFSLLGPEHDLWVSVRLPVVVGLSLLVFFFPKRSFAAHTLFYVLFAWFALPCMFPYADRYMHYELIKPLDVFSPFPERHLYTAYGQLQPAASPIEEAYRYWDYTYFPSALLLPLYHHGFNLDPRIPFLILFWLTAFGFKKFSEEWGGEFASLLLLVSPVPLLSFNPFYLTNLFLQPFALVLLALAYRFRKSNWIVSGLVIALAATMLQNVAPSVAFLSLVFWRNKGRKALALGLSCSALALAAFALPNPRAFYLCAIAHHAGMVDRAMFLAKHQLSVMALPGLLSAATGIDPDQIFNSYPAGLLGGITAVIFAGIAFYRRRTLNFSSALQLAALFIILETFLTKFNWIDSRYYICPALAFALRPDAAWLEGPDTPQKKLRALFIGLLLAHVLLLAIVKQSASTAFSFEPGNRIAFAFSGNAASGVKLQLSDLRTATPSVIPNVHSRYGWVNTQFGSQFWVIVPPGSYSSAICDNRDKCVSKVDHIDAGTSSALRIPFLIEEAPDKGITIAKGSIAGIAITSGEISLHQAASITVERIK